MTVPQNSGRPPASRLALGTVQFGLNYGVANLAGQISLPDAREVLTEARQAGLDLLDTAPVYGDSESRLGQLGVRDWRIVSKLPSLPPGIADVGRWVAAQVNGSCDRLGVARLYGVLLHRPGELSQEHGAELARALEDLKTSGRVEKVGVSIYDPAELPAITDRLALDLVQAPLNVFDRRLVQSGWLGRLAADGVEVHVRSIFLQGLLLLTELPDRFAPWRSLWQRWRDWLVASDRTPIEACVQFALSFPEVAQVVVGVDGVRQLREIITLAGRGSPAWPQEVWSEDPRLLNPSLWPLS
jgi:aryl-alcohol dehydrogenase-like predicted oxidoreductase